MFLLLFGQSASSLRCMRLIRTIFTVKKFVIILSCTAFYGVGIVESVVKYQPGSHVFANAALITVTVHQLKLFFV